MPARAAIAAALVVALTLPLAGCSREKEVRAAQAQRDALLASTLPKAEFWDAVTRKGELAKALKERQGEIARLEAERPALEAAIATAEASLVTQRAAREAADAQLVSARTEFAKARETRARREADLRGFGERRRAEAP